ncbi:hypothetical protein NKR23_g11013 [Pleurostoma richardsiae]|uniref:Uncharacterized protein n=1 Tax=Pleurostoma richardsiae TaxID=41990 RepID=A0AA38R487_9PEZI|nr:hypothetical protein NKR23_g11013 [Pleurostoma richardsiae]
MIRVIIEQLQLYPAKIPLALHAAVETAAALSFIFAPQRQLPGLNEDAKLILRSYGGLLLGTSLLCVCFLVRPVFDGATREIEK